MMLVSMGLVGEVIVNDDNSLSIEVNFTKMQKLLPNIQFMNRVFKVESR
jgi:hypothetical protein